MSKGKRLRAARKGLARNNASIPKFLNGKRVTCHYLPHRPITAPHQRHQLLGKGAA